MKHKIILDRYVEGNKERNCCNNIHEGCDCGDADDARLYNFYKEGVFYENLAEYYQFNWTWYDEV